MSIHYHFIINEHAASGNAKKAADTVIADANAQHVAFTTHYSQYSGHVMEIMADLIPALKEFSAGVTMAAEEFPLVVVIGGDGTLDEVMNA